MGNSEDGTTAQRSPGSAALGISLVGLIAVFTWWVMSLPEPASLGRAVAVLGTAVALGVVTFVVAVIVWRSGMRALAGTVVLGFLASFVLVWVAESIHWRWSRDAFEAVAGGEEIHCAEGDVCRLGWWRTVGSTRLDTMVIVWVPDDACYAGLGLAKPADEQVGLDALEATARAEDFPSDMVTASAWRDGWYRLCFVT